MNIRDDIKELKTDATTLRKFGLVVGSVFVLLGFVVSHVLLTLFFFLIMLPIGLIARLAGKDFLSLKLDRAAKSYWIKRTNAPKSAADYEKQF